MFLTAFVLHTLGPSAVIAGVIRSRTVAHAGSTSARCPAAKLGNRWRLKAAHTRAEDGPPLRALLRCALRGGLEHRVGALPPGWREHHQLWRRHAGVQQPRRAGSKHGRPASHALRKRGHDRRRLANRPRRQQRDRIRPRESNHERALNLLWCGQHDGPADSARCSRGAPALLIRGRHYRRAGGFDALLLQLLRLRPGRIK